MLVDVVNTFIYDHSCKLWPYLQLLHMQYYHTKEEEEEEEYGIKDLN